MRCAGATRSSPCARRAPRELRLAGAAFPWRTIRGEECSGYWPAGTAAFHVNADIADAVRRYVAATGDAEFERGPASTLLVETARLWRSLGHHDAEGCFRIDGVTGPGRVHARSSTTTSFTNLMAARNLAAAADVAARYPRARGRARASTSDEIEAWRDAADAMVVPFDEELGVTSQSEGFTRYRAGTSRARAGAVPAAAALPVLPPLLEPGREAGRPRLRALPVRRQFTAEQKRRDFDYYEPITVRDSSLSASIQAIVAAEVGHLELAYDYFRESAFVDLHDLNRNTADGLHLASLAGRVARGRGRVRRSTRRWRHPRVRAAPAARP